MSSLPTSPSPTSSATADATREVRSSNEYPSWYPKTCADLSHGLTPSLVSSKLTGIANVVFISSSFLWKPGAVITYSYVPGDFQGTSIQQRKVDVTVSGWSVYANITFQRVDSGGNLRVTFDPSLGSWSYVGTQNLKIPANQTTLNLGWVDKTNPAMGAYEKGTILHEFGHALGLLHEHQSPARPGSLTLNEEAVYQYYGATQGWDRQEIKQQVIDVYTAADVSNYSQLDTTSIMMYYMPAELNLQHVDVPPNTVLSDLDKAYAMLNYQGSKASPAQASGWTISHALDVAGVTGSSRDKILQSTDPLEIRKLFFSWNAAQKNKVNNGGTTGGTNSSTATNTSANTIVPVTGSKPSGLIGRIEGILKEAKVPTATVDTVNAALKKELALLSQSVAKHVLDG